MSRNIYHPTTDRNVARNTSQVKTVNQKPEAFRWWVPECDNTDAGDIAFGCTGDEPPLETGFIQSSPPLERWKFRVRTDGELEFGGVLEVSGAASGDVAVILPGLTAGEADLLPDLDQSYGTFVTLDGTTVIPASAYVDTTTAEVKVSWAGASEGAIYAFASCISDQTSSFPADVIDGFSTRFPLTEGYSSDPAVLEPDDTAIGIRIHEPGFIIATCRCTGWDNWTGAGNEVLEAVKTGAPALIGSDYVGVSYAPSNFASAVAGTINEADPNTLLTDSFILTSDDIMNVALIHSATVGAFINQVDLHVAWFATYPAPNGQVYIF